MIKTIQSITEWVVTILFACLTVLGGMQVFFRYVLGNSLTWSEEVSKIFFFYIIYLTASLAIKNRAFASVDFLYQYFPANMKRAVDILNWSIILAFLFLVIILGSQMTIKTIHQITPALELPQAAVYFCLPLGAILMIFPALNILLKLITGKP
jgi:TRAP-type C4-dicarboxylate transport system permease small subunit